MADRFIVRKPNKVQLFHYQFTDPEAGDAMLKAQDIQHALCNCDQYPVSFPEMCKPKTHDEQLCADMLNAVLSAIFEVPMYKMGEDMDG